MIHVSLFCHCVNILLAASFSLRLLDERLDCRQQGLDSCKIKSCSDKRAAVQRQLAPTGPELDPERVGLWVDQRELVPVVNVTWTIEADASVFKLRGSVIKILDEITNHSMCLQFSYNLSQTFNPILKEKWRFSLDCVAIEPGHTYVVSVYNLPEPEIGHYRSSRQISVPGCDDKRLQKAHVCRRNGSLWDPNVAADVFLDEEHRTVTVVVGFKAARYSESYRVSIQSHNLFDWRNVSKENKTSLNVTFEFGLWQLSQCEMLLKIQPFFMRCKNDCWCPVKTINYCQYYPPRTLILKATVGLIFVGIYLAFLLWKTTHKDPKNLPSSAAKEQPEIFQVQERKRVLIIYSLDHLLYKNIVLKLSAFLLATCGTEVVLDLLDSTRLGVLGSIQWLDWHREQIEGSSDKILILCSRGVQAKWRAMCGGRRVFLRADSSSPVGDMLSPALSLIIPHFIRSVSFEKYIVAYFDDVCSEENVPSPFMITVRYKLMKQFEEVFFRILDTEKHEPGRVKYIEGISEDEYLHCPSGRALRDAIKAFHAYQLENPKWFEDELLESSELEAEETAAEIWASSESTPSFTTPHSVRQESDLIQDETIEFQMCSLRT